MKDKVHASAPGGQLSACHSAAHAPDVCAFAAALAKAVPLPEVTASAKALALAPCRSLRCSAGGQGGSTAVTLHSGRPAGGASSCAPGKNQRCAFSA
jgi:hypothetical protein